MDPSKVTKMVVDTRLEQVASALEKLPQVEGSTGTTTVTEDTADVEKELLAMDTPAQSPPRAPATPTDPSNTIVVNNTSVNTVVDTVGDRVDAIFGKKRTNDNADQSESSPVKATKVIETSNTETPIAAGGDDENIEAPVKTSDAEPPKVNPNDNDVDMEQGGAIVDNAPAVIDMNVSDDEAIGGNDGGAEQNNIRHDPWPEENDNPENFPEVGFPIEPPQYPAHPEFEYRYRAGPNSTPQRRRQDFERSIVVPSCRRDPHTGRIAQEDYDAREDAEMALSLG